MASGKVHAYYYNKGWYFIAISSIPLSIGMGLLWNSILFGFLFFIFYVINYWKCSYISPDQDLLLLTDSEWKIISDGKKYLWWFGGFFATSVVAWWLLYGYLCGKHRSWYSHWWLIGTLGRMLHHNIPIAYFFAGINNWNIYNAYYNQYMNYWLMPYITSQFISWFIADGIHLVLDTKKFKQLNKEKIGVRNVKKRKRK